MINQALLAQESAAWVFREHKGRNYRTVWPKASTVTDRFDLRATFNNSER